MDWRFVLQMGSLGLLVGIVTVFGWLPGLEMPLWLGIGFVWVVTAARRVPETAFQHVFVTSLLAGFLSGDVPAIAFGTFVDHNQALLNSTSGDFTRTTLLTGGILWGGLFGLLTGGVAALASRASRPRPVPDAIGAPMDLTHPGEEEE